MDEKFLKEMLQTISVSGHEEELQRKIIQRMEGQADEILTDAVGNVITVLNPQSQTRVLLCGHIDEIGMIITEIRPDGFLKVTNAGGVRARLYPGVQVQIKSAGGILYGVVVTNSELLKQTDLSCTDLTIDIGASSFEEASAKVAVGDPLCAAAGPIELLNHRMAARAMDNRIGAFIVQEALLKAKEKNCQIGVYSAATVGEETTMRGAFWAAQKVKPACALIVDVTYTSDYPGVSAAATGDIRLDRGPVLCHSSIVSKKMNSLLKECAKRLNIEVQWEIAVGRTGTDGDKVHFSNDGVPVALVSIPLRYMHSSIETLSLLDVEQIIDLLAEFLCSFSKELDLNPLS